MTIARVTDSGDAERSEWWIRRAFVFVGRIAFDKGLDTVVGAWLRLARDREDVPPLWVVGGTPAEVDAFRAAIGIDRLRKFETSGQLEWWGYLDAPGISAVLLKAAVLVTHSRYEPGGRVVLEALTAGLPVIATAHGFARELVRDWVSGFIVPFGDEALLARRMEHFARQPYLRNALGYYGRKAALASLNSWRFVDTHCEVYDRLAAREAPPVSATAPVLPPDTSFFDRRILAPTYPLTSRVPPQDRASDLIAQVSGVDSRRLKVTQTDRGSSLVWRITDGTTRWLVKHPYSRIEVRPLWDPSRPMPLVQDANERFAQDRFSATLPGFAGFISVDAADILLAREEMQQIEGMPTAEEIAQLLPALRLLHDAEPVDLTGIRSVICRDWRRASQGSVREAMAEIAAWIGCSGVPWHSGHHFGLSLSWRVLQCDLKEGRLTIGTGWSEHDQRLADLLADFAGKPTRVVICHGSPHIRHFIRTRAGEWSLIDGERVHPSEPEEDFAYLAFRLGEYALKQTGVMSAIGTAIQTITVDDNARLRLLSWCGLHAVEGLCRQSYFGRRRSVAKYESLWRAVGQATSLLRGESE